MREFLIFIFVFFSTQTFSQDSCEKEIYSCFLAPPATLKADTVFNKRGKVVKINQPTFDNFVIDQFTNRISNRIESFESLVKSGLSDLENSTYEDFKKKNWQSLKIDEFKVTNRLVFFIDTLESKRIVENNDWTSFMNKYQNAKLIISLSKIGYNIDKTQALLYSTNRNYLTGKYGFYTLFELVDNRWKISQSTMVFL